MFSKGEFQNIKDRYGECASWAIWNKEDESDTKIIEEQLENLHSEYVGIGLNISQKVSLWGNFRGGKHDRKLKYAFNHTKIRGSYLTDLIKNVVGKNSSEILRKVKNREINIDVHVDSFKEEMKDLKIDDSSKFLVFGSAARELFESHYEKHFPENKAYFLKHYSSRGTDEEWVTNVCDRLNVDEDFDTVLSKYRYKK